MSNTVNIQVCDIWNTNDKNLRIYHSKGLCNGRWFECLLLLRQMHDIIDSYTVSYDENYFSFSEINEIKHKSSLLAESLNHATVYIPLGDFKSLKTNIKERVKGEKVYLDVPAADLEHAESLGIRFDSLINRRYVYSKSLNRSLYERWLPTLRNPK